MIKLELILSLEALVCGLVVRAPVMIIRDPGSSPGSAFWFQTLVFPMLIQHQKQEGLFLVFFQVHTKSVGHGDKSQSDGSKVLQQTFTGAKIKP